MKQISIIIPVYNEEKRITSAIEKITAYFKKHDYWHEIILVDDGSTDKTIQKSKDTKEDIQILQNKQNTGKGYSVKQGMLHAKGDYLLFTDADMSTPIEELDKFIQIIDTGFDIVIGSRAVHGADIKKRQPLYRELIGKTFNKIVRLITVRGIKDTQCGFKLFKKNCVKEIFGKQTIERFCFDVEVLHIAKKKGYKIKEVPVIWINDNRTTVKPIKDALRMLRDIIKIRLNSIRGKYD